uniref:TAF5-like RNA polymerase II p300/CBP-associated factor-associated factor subunit 5L n=1 Tax=Lygus hesperus TaxID=30085 RepID=A0A0A9YIA8_LYGHE
MEVYEADELTTKLLNYFERRNYLSSEPQGFKEDEAEVARIIERATVLPYSASAESVVLDLPTAERQFTKFVSWVSELGPDASAVDLKSCLMPLLCHIYLNCLPVHPKTACVKFLRVLSVNLVTDQWVQFMEQLLAVDNVQNLSAQPLIKSYREVRLELNLLPKAVVLLRKFLASNDLYVIIQVMRQWFRITVLTDDVLNCEEEPKDVDHDKPPRLEAFSSNDVKEEVIEDQAMADLLRDINGIRTQPTPPPPLLLYTAHRTEGIVCGSVSEDWKLAATGDMRSELKVWGLGETKLTPQLHDKFFSSIPINTHTEPIDNSAAAKDKQMWWLRGHSATVQDVAFLNDSDYLLSVSYDCTMRLWKLADFSCSVVYRGHSSPIWGVAVSPIANMVATASSDKTARVWNLDRTFPVRILGGHLQDVTCVAFHPNGSYVASGSPDKTVRLWSVTDGNMMRVFGGSGQGPVDALAFSPNGQFVASAGDDQFVWLWDLASGSVVCKLSGHTSRIISMAWNYDGSALSAAAHDGVVYLWNLDTPEACDGTIEPKKYITKCSILLSLRYSTKNALVGVGLS